MSYLTADPLTTESDVFLMEEDKNGLTMEERQIYMLGNIAHALLFINENLENINEKLEDYLKEV